MQGALTYWRRPLIADRLYPNCAQHSTVLRPSASCSGKAALWRFASVPGPTVNACFGSTSPVRQAVGGCPLIAHSSHSRGLLLASDDAESAAYPTVDKGSGNLGTPPALQRVPHAPRRGHRCWRDMRRPTGRRSSRIGKAWGPNTCWVRRLPCRQRRPTKALQRALTACGRTTTAFGLQRRLLHDLAAIARMALTSAATSRRLAIASAE
jgi:hypothetical protein